MNELDGAEVRTFKDAEVFKAWLSDNYTKEEGVWLKLAKKSSNIPSLTDDEAVDIGLCWGWISGQRRSYDESYYLQKYVPRRPRSIWSQVNVKKVEVLTKAGRMQPSGLIQVSEAKADGRWEVAYVSQRNATPPPDLLEALEQNKKAKQYFSQMSKADQYAVIFRIVTARTKPSRIEKMKKMITLMEAHQKIR